MTPLSLYKKLFHKYGAQNWWPVTDNGSIAPAYKKRKRLSEKQKLEICVGAILAQNTSWKNVEKAIINLSRAQLMSIECIDKTKEKELAELIRPSGYFNLKAKKLKKFAEHVSINYNGKLSIFFRRDLPKLREELLGIWGIGEETADSILCYAAGKDVLVMDAYTKRIAERVYGKEFNSYAELQEFFVSQLKGDNAFCNEFHALLVEHAKRYCAKSKPNCKACPTLKNCCFPVK